MARLETLEAKMASIEVSLSSGGAGVGRRRKGAASPGPRASSSSNKENSVTTPTGRQQVRLVAVNMRNIQQNQLQTSTTTIGDGREERLRRLKAEAEAKKLAIKNIKVALDRLDITDNIDVRIRQAELEYQLGREELNLLTITEEARRLHEEIVQEEAQTSSGLEMKRLNGSEVTLQALLGVSRRAELVCVKAQWDRSGPRFGVTLGRSGTLGLPIEWAAEGSELRRGDTILEVNGRLTSGGSWSREDLARALASKPTPADIVVLRRCEIQPKEQQQEMETEVAVLRQELGAVRAGADEARKAKDGLRADNLRLTHRISYLEEQVQELLDRHGRSNSPCVTSVIDLGSGQVYQKQRTATGRSVRSLDLEADYASEPSPVRHHRCSRPQPPKKPLRLSLHRRAHSLQSVDQDTPNNAVTAAPIATPNTQTVEPTVRKRTHKGECPQTAVRWTTSPARTRAQGNKWS